MAAPSATNQDILRTIQDLMQLTGDGFAGLSQRMDRLEVRMGNLEVRMGDLEERMDSVESRLSQIELELQAVRITLREHDLQLSQLRQICQELHNHHKAYINDVSDILDRIAILEDRTPLATKAEVRELQTRLQVVVRWAIRAAKTMHVPLKLPK